MSDAPKVVWTGASGKTYTYSVYDIAWRPAKDQNGNYIFAKEVGDYYEPVYIGQGDLASRKAAHLANGCVTQKGATYFLCHLNKSQTARLAEEDDLLDAYPEAYLPTGCNERPGG